jgi:crossover junction endodeoxyribonuclease RuvC
MFVLGVDPGLDGAVAWLSQVLDGSLALGAAVMPTKVGPNGRRQVDARALADFVTTLPGAGSGPDLVVFEQVHSKPTDGSASAFSFGKSTGKALAVFEMLVWPLEEVTPPAWKKAILAGTDHSKEAAIGWAQSRFPGVSLLATPRCKKPHDGLAEALCLAEYARRRLVGEKGS